MPILENEQNPAVPGPNSPGAAGTLSYFRQGQARSTGVQITTEGDITYAGTLTGPGGTVSSLAWFNVVAYGASPSASAATNDTAIAAAVTAANAAGGGVIYFPAGTYSVATAITLNSDTILQGDGITATTISQTSTSANGVTASDNARTQIRDMDFVGPGSGTGIGIDYSITASPNTAHHFLSNVRVLSFGSHGIQMENPIVSVLTNVVAQTNGGHGFQLIGQVGGASGTSVSLISCYANANTSNGYRLFNMTYTALHACAADSNVVGYEIQTCQGVSLTACGAESNTSKGIAIEGGFGVTVNGYWNYDNLGIGLHCTTDGANDAEAVTIIGAVENTPDAGATAFIDVDAGCSVALLNYNNTTANSLASGTTSILSDTINELIVAGPTFLGVTEVEGAFVFNESGTDIDFRAEGDTEVNLLFLDASTDRVGIGTATPSERLDVVGGNISISTAGNGLHVAEGANAKMGTATLSSGTVTVSTTAVSTNSRIFLTVQTLGTVSAPQAVHADAIVNGTSFDITSADGTDTSVVAWMIVDPA